MKTFKELQAELQETSKAKFAAVARRKYDPESESGSVKDLVGLARKQHGDKFASDMEGAWKAHYPRPDKKRKD